MIRHIVLTRFAPDVSEDEIREIYTGLAALVERLPGARDFKGGRSSSSEQIERGYHHGFVIDFDDWPDLQTYAENPEHKALGARLVENAIGGVDGLLVLDIEV
ncbi:Dabb family protein [Ponticoccus sp. SC2-23]|uniref:Dabb family protein n=1 Tax=Alexandriicola marinus TaxID=2081710 RepID=UPI000FD99BD8|nr:Dabb family protein [Alexandriicola marinus]MBM1222354.1 Dabb family protein [Ponticoccus sp. SC6-9]MBM1224467.1 Dabb family protein [Ponticoccus sp. SC6-15]MBM1229753.1 Dabb family protein [Ponticoccus sp. SC6-38]MBM1233433.1 Dabb family protein [Ponticoccus sp. SC6-45]MBM1236617.1 Dabb family protein [Ponticoccus sp. SC6-49]MBM1244661.1 Dabb family protein [Ponticoccus sp. SC2-64]MBM1246957.1 Dabb family protein [Ponticoccus sp. SC6-42]MBM1251435.1 Dabb family protein [Ponticoccus sp. 